MLIYVGILNLTLGLIGRILGWLIPYIEPFTMFSESLELWDVDTTSPIEEGTIETITSTQNDVGGFIVMGVLFLLFIVVVYKAYMGLRNMNNGVKMMDDTVDIIEAKALGSEDISEISEEYKRVRYGK